ncbi:MAG TPA: hypothetical protein VOB72_03175 [Candidatus Dormibacteraeota bacterium]|nr:hypothetical protein [Candidatus Dormibacteraeota bacterium]
MGFGAAELAASAQSSLARVRPIVGRLSLGALGLALVLLVSAAWGTGVFYLLARLGETSPIRLASLDGIHAYVGLAGGVFVVAKVARVGLRHRVEGVPNVVPWQRWLSWSMLVLYGAVFVTGVLALLPVPGRIASGVIEMHLLTSVWALLPTTWHVWHYRARARPYVRRWARRAAGRRFWAAAVVLVLPAPLLVADAPAVSELPSVLGGAAWSPVAPLKGSYLDVVAEAPDGRTLVAAGDALYVSHDGGVVWLRTDLPAGSAPAAASPPAEDHAGHEHGAPAPANPITALAVGPGPVFVGTSGGLYAAASLDAQLAPVPLPGSAGVRALAMDAADPQTLWLASTAGPLHSADGGRTWTRQAAGLAQPAGAAAVAYLGGDVYLSDGTGVFRWTGAAWTRVSAAASIGELSAAGGSLYAAGAGGDLQVLAAGRWTDLGQPAPVHTHHGHVHGQPATVTVVDGRLYAAGTSNGVSASANGGRTWTQLGGGLGTTTPGQVVAYRDALWAAGSDGLYRFPLTFAPGPAAEWWLLVIGLAVVAGVVAVALGAPERARRIRSS